MGYMKKTSYAVAKRRNYDGYPEWVWVLFIDGEEGDFFGTEAEAWAAAEQDHAESQQAEIADILNF